MAEFPGYGRCEAIYESRSSLVCRGLRERDGQSVVLKLLRGSHPGNRALARFRQEYELLRDLHGPAVVQAFGLEEHGNSLVLVLEDFGGESLKKLSEQRRFALDELLAIFVEVAGALDGLHRRHLVHKDVNPANIVYNPDTGLCKLIDFGIAARLSPTHPVQGRTESLAGTLAYISPEQTGRMNRQLDYRSDLYSVGVSLYELLAGRLPFEPRHSLEMVHAHIAGVAPPLLELNPEVPPQLCAIVERLMAKTAEQRYQSAAGLRADLETCLDSLRETGRIEAFALGRQDHSDVFYLPQRLYGREAQVAILLDVFEQAVLERGERLMLLVSGYSGTGKTSLVKEIYKPVTHRRGWFIEGKFDQYQRSTPYSALKQALAGLVDGWLAASDERLAGIAAALREALGENAGLMLELAPALELVLGPQPAVPVLAGVEAQNRFNYTCRRFFRAVAAEQHPLVLFIDDLQWADLASLNLLSVLLTDGQLSHLMLIGAYRDNETSPSHPLMLTLERLSKSAVQAREIALGNLSPDDLTALCAEALRRDPAEVTRLAFLIHTKTLGNAFFVTQFLKALYADGLIAYDPGRKGWAWDIERIEGRDIPDDVVRLMAAKIAGLAPEPRRLLTLAACIGNAFRLDTLAAIAEGDPETVRGDLAKAVREGLLIPLERDWYRFSHDRIQQAAYSLVADSEQTHLRIGRLLRAGGEPAGDAVFQAANQLNAARRLLTDPGERHDLVRLNREAGRLARRATAYEGALGYFSQAAGLLPEDAWESRHSLSFDIHCELAWCRFYAGETEGIETLFEILLEQARELDERQRVQAIQMEYHHLAGDYARAVAIQLQALGELGVSVDEARIGEQLQQELGAVEGLLGGRSIESLADGPVMDDPRQAAVMDILMGLWTSAYLASKLELVAWSSCKMTTISLQYGNNRLSSYGYMNYAFVCVAMLGQYETGHRFGRMALRLAERFDDLLLRGKVYLLFAVFINHWREPLAGSLDYSLKAFPLLVENGDWTYAGYCAEFIISDPTIWGMDCGQILREAERYLPFLQNNAPVVLDEFVRPACLNPVLQLLGRTRGDDSFDDECFREQDFLRDYRANPLALSYYYTAKLRSLYWFGYWDQALAMIDQADFVASVAMAQAKVPEVYFFAALTILGCFEALSAAEQKRLGDRVQAYQGQMKLWADQSPANFRHKYLLVEAERARIRRQPWEALGLYEAAIEAAREGCYVNNEALACECAARFLVAEGKPRAAAQFMHESRYAWHRWGASAKVRQLEQRHGELFAGKTSVAARESSLSMLTTGNETLQYGVTAVSLDIFSIVQASQSLAGEIGLDRLLEKMMKIASENAGADRCVLLTREAGRWCIRAETRAGWDAVSIPEGDAAAAEASGVPLSLVNYCARKRESLVLGNIGANGSFGRDPYLIATAMKSVLGIPLLRGDTLQGVLYLENSLVEEAFSRERLEVLRLLSSQMAISIENALFYRELEQRVAQRTEALVQVNAELQAANRQLETLSNMDGLTQVANRRMLDAFIDTEWRRHCRTGQDFSLILCDVDHFKAFNDTYGHLEGDHCLQRVARAIREAVQRPGDLVARYGGEEFAVVLTETGLAGAKHVIDVIRRNLAALNIPHTDTPGGRLTLSIGALHTLPRDGTGVREAIMAADQALYRAKAEGRDRVVISRGESAR